MIYQDKDKTNYGIKLWFMEWLTGWCQIVDGLIGVLTFNHYFGDLSVSMMERRMIAKIKIRKEKRKRNEPMPHL